MSVDTKPKLIVFLMKSMIILGSTGFTKAMCDEEELGTHHVVIAEKNREEYAATMRRMGLFLKEHLLPGLLLLFVSAIHLSP